MKKRTWAAAGTAGLLVATAVTLGVTSQSASAADPGPIGAQQAVESTLTLKTTGTTTTVKYSSSTATQTLNGTNCVYAPSTTQFLQFGVTGPKVGSKDPGVGFKSNSLGVRSGNDSNGTACQQVNTNTNPKETLAFTLNASTTSSLFGPAQFKSAKIDVNLSGNAIIRAYMYKTGVTDPIGTAELQSGFSAPQGPDDASGQLQVCNFSSNSGPQSGFNNNCYWTIDPLTVAEGYYDSDTKKFVGGGGYIGSATTPTSSDLLYDRIVLVPIIGDFSVQGGNAYPTGTIGSAGTIFTLAALSDGTIGCYDGTEGSLATSQAAPLSDPRAVLTRLQLGDTTKTCVLKAYDLNYANNTVTYRQQITGDQATSQYALVLPRDYAAGTQQFATLPPVKVDWEDGAVATLPFCPAGLIKATTGQYFVPSDYDYSKAGADQSGFTDGKQYACVYKQTLSVNGADGKVTAFDYIYFAGDARFAP